MGSILFYFGVIFFLHGSICCAFLPDFRKISCFAYQRIIGSLICYYECAGFYGWVGSGIIQPIIAAISCWRNLVAWCQHRDR